MNGKQPFCATPYAILSCFMKNKAELEKFIEKIVSPDSPVGMDAVYVHALILDKLTQIEEKLEQLQLRVAEFEK